MKNSIKKSIAAVICSSLLITSGIYATPAFAAKDRVTQKETSTTVDLPPVKKGNAYIPKGTKLELVFYEELSSKYMKLGEPVPIAVADNVIINDVIIIPAGTKVRAFITKVRKAANFGRGGKLEFQVESVPTLNGVAIPLQCAEGAYGQNDVAGSTAVIMAVSAIGGFFMKGKNVNIAAGTRFNVEVPDDADLNVSLENLEEEMDSNKPKGIYIFV